MKKLFTLLLLTFFTTTFYTPQVMAATQVKVPRGTRVLVQVSGKDKSWVVPVSCVGLFLWPLLLVGFVKGKQAEIPANKIYEIRFDNAYNMPSL